MQKEGTQGEAASYVLSKYHTKTGKLGWRSIAMDDSEFFPALIVNRCPLGCDRPCARIWINETIGHSIVCQCLCGHNEKQTVLELVGGNRESNAVSVESSSSEAIRDED